MKKIIATALCLAFVCAAFAGCSSSSGASAPASSAPASEASSEVASQPAAESEAASEAASQPAAESGEDLSAIVAAIEAANPVSNPLTIEDFSMENDFNLTMENVEAYQGEMSNDQGNSALVLVVKAVEGKAADVKAELETYKQNQIAYYGNYAEFAAGQESIENGIVQDFGDYVVVVFANTEGADYDAIQSAVTAALG